jgi:hypothetical protein
MKSDGGQCAWFEDVSDNEDLALVADGGTTCPPEGTSATESDEAPRGAHTHSSALSPVFGPNPHAVQTAGHFLPDGTFELQASSTAKIDRPWKMGNTYSHVQVLEEARVHLGDSYTVNNHYSGPTTTGEEHILTRIKATEESLKTLPDITALVKVLLQTNAGLLVLLQIILSSLPKHISDELAVFEDALGRFQRIDLRFLDNWPAFQRRLECDFHDTPGSRRILGMKYRLFDRVGGGSYLVDPRHPPPFAIVFQQGRHVQMSIHFEWNEVSDEQCPRCGLEQECKVNAETICAGCKFGYRGQVESARVKELFDEETPAPENTSDHRRWLPRNTSRPRLELEARQRDTPSSFSRITISKRTIFRSQDGLERRMGSHSCAPKAAWKAEVRDWVQRAFNPENAIQGISDSEWRAYLLAFLPMVQANGEIDTIDWYTYPTPQQLIVAGIPSTTLELGVTWIMTTFAEKERCRIIEQAAGTSDKKAERTRRMKRHGSRRSNRQTKTREQTV